jgi:predicted nucleic acid-binding protein
MLDALHLATAELLKSYGQALRIATYDLRMREAAAAMEYELL